MLLAVLELVCRAAKCEWATVRQVVALKLIPIPIPMPLFYATAFRRRLPLCSIDTYTCSLLNQLSPRQALRPRTKKAYL
jgi:hypothetical protein